VPVLFALLLEKLNVVIGDDSQTNVTAIGAMVTQMQLRFHVVSQRLDIDWHLCELNPKLLVIEVEQHLDVVLGRFVDVEQVHSKELLAVILMVEVDEVVSASLQVAGEVSDEQVEAQVDLVDHPFFMANEECLFEVLGSLLYSEGEFVEVSGDSVFLCHVLHREYILALFQIFDELAVESLVVHSVNTLDDNSCVNFALSESDKPSTDQCLHTDEITQFPNENVVRLLVSVDPVFVL